MADIILYLFFGIFGVLLWGVSAYFSWMFFLSVASILTLFLKGLVNSVGSMYPFRRPTKPTPKKSTRHVRLEDPIGVMSMIAHRYNEPLFLKDLTFLEVQLFGSSSSEVSDWFHTAEEDPRPEVCGAFAGKILLKLARNRQEYIQTDRWSEDLEAIWKKGVPKEFRDLVSDQKMAS